MIHLLQLMSSELAKRLRKRCCMGNQQPGGFQPDQLSGFVLQWFQRHSRSAWVDEVDPRVAPPEGSGDLSPCIYRGHHLLQRHHLTSVQAAWTEPPPILKTTPPCASTAWRRAVLWICTVAIHLPPSSILPPALWS